MTTHEESYPTQNSPTGSDTSSESDFDHLPSSGEHTLSNSSRHGLGVGSIPSSSSSTSSNHNGSSMHLSPKLSNHSPPKPSLQTTTKPPSPPSTTTAKPLRPSQPHPNLPKSQPLSRTLFARMASSSGGFTCVNSDVPHAGMGGAGKKRSSGGQKLIVPTKGFRTTFELGLTSSEFARK